MALRASAHANSLSEKMGAGQAVSKRAPIELPDWMKKAVAARKNSSSQKTREPAAATPPEPKLSPEKPAGTPVKPAKVAKAVTAKPAPAAKKAAVPKVLGWAKKDNVSSAEPAGSHYYTIKHHESGHTVHFSPEGHHERVDKLKTEDAAKKVAQMHHKAVTVDMPAQTRAASDDVIRTHGCPTHPSTARWTGTVTPS
jgi:hypothetical protein